MKHNILNSAPSAQSEHVSLARARYGKTLGLPQGWVYTVSGSELKSSVCDRYFLLGSIEGLRREGTQKMDLGTAWHDVVEDIWAWWRLHDKQYPADNLHNCCWACEGTGNVALPGGDPCEVCRSAPGCGPIERAFRILAHITPDEGYFDPANIDMGQDELDAIEKLRVTLQRMAEGYLAYYEGRPMDSWRVGPIEVSMARQICHIHDEPGHKAGRPLVKRMLVHEQERGQWVPATPTTDPARVRRINASVYFVGRSDSIFIHRRTSAGMIVDAKSGDTARRYIDAMGVDPQLPAYAWLAEPHLETFGCSGITGMMYDFTATTFQRDPKQLQWKPPKFDDLKAMAAERGLVVKGRKVDDYVEALGIVPGAPELSRDASALTPSWRYKMALLSLGKNIEDYAEHLEHLIQNVDNRLYQRIDATYSPRQAKDAAAEIYYRVRHHIDLYQRAHRDVGLDPEVLAQKFPRVPTCLLGFGGCALRDVCTNDSPESRAAHGTSPTHRWQEPGARLPLAMAATEPTQTGDSDDFPW